MGISQMKQIFFQYHVSRLIVSVGNSALLQDSYVGCVAKIDWRTEERGTMVYVCCKFRINNMEKTVKLQRQRLSIRNNRTNFKKT